MSYLIFDYYSLNTFDYSVVFYIYFSNSSSSSKSFSFYVSIWASLGCNEAFISVVRWVRTCLDFLKSLILNLYLYKSFSLFVSLSILSCLSSLWSFICLFFSSSFYFTSFFSAFACLISKYALFFSASHLAFFSFSIF